MRLNLKDKKAISSIVHHFFGETAKVWLFGSRLHNNLQGGDIDLYIETPLTSGVFDAKIQAKVALYHSLNHVPIDLVVRKFDGPLTGIHKVAKAEGVLL